MSASSQQITRENAPDIVAKNGQERLASDTFPGFLVAVGASAGGLEALERFFNHCPSDTGAAFVVIQHLSPNHKSMMHDLLGRYTQMEVNVVADAMRVQANNVYLIPPGTIMRIAFPLPPRIRTISPCRLIFF